jgi:phage terminase Nu1 subunit (DNA packaging protein)
MLLGLPERSFYRLVEEGVIPKCGDGEYILGEVEEAYWKDCLGSEGLEAARTRLATAQAERVELELAEQRGEVHRASAVMRVWADNVINTKTRLLALPSKLAPELQGKTLQEIQARLKEEINEALNELAEYDERRITRTAASFK